MRSLRRSVQEFIKYKLCIIRRASSVEYTWKNYNVERRTDFAKVEADDLSFFNELLPGRVVTDEHELESHNTDWLHLVRGMSQVMLKPKTTEEVSKIMKYCNHRSLAVCPQGGNTGLVGGSVPVFDEVILSFALMNKIQKVDAASGFAVCQAGVVLEQLDQYLRDYSLMVPLDLGAKGSCHIGGNVSTNAGGLRYLRYGSLHGSVLGVEAVLADGTILDCLSTLKKDNTGYDLKQLFIGSEGTLGVVTAISLACPPRPKSVNLMFLGLDSYDKIQETFILAKSMFGEVLSAFEFLDNECRKAVIDHLKYQYPIEDEYPFYVLIETSGSDADHDTEKLNRFLEHVMDKGVVNDGTVATEPSKMYDIWKVREGVAQAVLHDGPGCYKYDISLPVANLYEIVNICRERFGDDATRIVGYGHFGDGNLHLNVVMPNYDKEFLKILEPVIFEYTGQHGGSISAEHGVGFKKANHIHYSRSPEAIEVMRKLKHVMDPKWVEKGCIGNECVNMSDMQQMIIAHHRTD